MRSRGPSKSGTSRPFPQDSEVTSTEPVVPVPSTAEKITWVVGAFMVARDLFRAAKKMFTN